MLKELTRLDWMSMLKIPEDRVPRAVILRGTRNMKARYAEMKCYFTDILEIGLPNGIIEDVFIGNLNGDSVAYASVYGAPMASEIAHVFGVLGTRLVIQMGCCGGLADQLKPGDLFVAAEAYCGDGASQYYRTEKGPVRATVTFEEETRNNSTPIHKGRIFTTAALFAEGERDIQSWHEQGYSAVDLETAATFAVAEHFGMERGSILFVFDNPRRKEHIFVTDAEKANMRAIGDRRMLEFVLTTVRNYNKDKGWKN